jgi:hypothetical protein
MRDRRIALLPFVVVLGSFSIPSLAAYCLFVQQYQRFILYLAEGALRLVGGDALLWVGHDGRWGVFPSRGGGSLEIGGPRYALGFFLAAAILPPLMAASITSLTPRIRKLALAMILVVLFHVGSVLFLVFLRTTYCDGGFASAACGNIKGAIIYVNQALALCIWWWLASIPSLGRPDLPAQRRAVPQREPGPG